MKEAILTLEWQQQGATLQTAAQRFSFLHDYELGIKMWNWIRSYPTRPTRLVLEFL